MGESSSSLVHVELDGNISSNPVTMAVRGTITGLDLLAALK
jgi:hypothetical protein